MNSRSWSHNRNCTDWDFSSRKYFASTHAHLKAICFLVSAVSSGKYCISFGFFSYSLYFWNKLVHLSFWTLDALFFLFTCTLLFYKNCVFGVVGCSGLVYNKRRSTVGMWWEDFQRFIECASESIFVLELPSPSARFSAKRCWWKAQASAYSSDNKWFK